jgi:hypothetical protein
MTKRFVVGSILAAMVPLGCGSVASKSDAGPGGSGGDLGSVDAGNDVASPTDGVTDGTAGAAGGTAGATGGAAGSDGGVRTDGGVDAGLGGAGGTAASCVGAGICGRGPTGIFCAQSNGASAFTAWTSWTDGYSDADGWKATPAYWATIQFPDVNGDGKADVCGRAGAGIYCGLSTGAGTFATPTFWSTGYADSGGWDQFPYYWATVQFPDVNGDGKADVCGRAGDGVYCGVSTGVNGFGPVTSWVANFADAGSWATSQSYWGTLQFPDVNGDGKSDICARGQAGIYCAVSNGTSAFGAVTLWQAQYSDTNGWNSSPSFWGTVQFPDINGDGKADVCGRGTGGISCAISNGTNGFGPATYWSADYSNAGGWQDSQSYWGTIQFPDINGDGKADVCGRGIAGVACGISNGSSAFSGPTSWAPAFSDAAGFNTDASGWGTIQFPDLDGDGKADVCGRTAAGITCGLSNGATGFNTASWLDQFTDTNGWRTDLSYGGTLQTPNLNVTGCNAVSKRSTYSQPLSRRMAPF